MKARTHAAAEMLLLVAVLLSSTTGTNNYQSSASLAQFPVAPGSWNPRVTCSSPSIVRITDITDNMTGSASYSSSTFSPGITSPVGTAKRWLTPGSTPPGWVSPGPPCTITNPHGNVAVFVEIDGVKRGNPVTNEDCTGKFDTVNGGTSNGGVYCDSTFNFYDPTVLPSYANSCLSATDPTCYGRIHSEIDHDWKGAHYCGSSTTCDNVTLVSQTTTSTLIDVQGFIYWDPGNLNQAWHSFSGWEIHPLTGWRLHQSSSSLATSFTFNPSSPIPSQAVTFTAAASGGISPYMFNWSFGDGGTATGSTVTHAFSAGGSYTVTLTTSDSASHTALASETVTVSSGEFKLTASAYNLTVLPGQNGQSQISVTSLSGFQGTVSLTTSVSSSGLTVSMQNPSVNLSPGQTQNDNLQVSATNTTPAGNYTVGVRGTSGTISHLLNVTVTVPKTDFKLTANPLQLTLQMGQNSQSQIVATSLDGFQGTVSFNVSVSSPGLTVSIEHPSVNLSAGQTQNDNLRISANSATPSGIYIIRIDGTSGLIAHSLNVTATVPKTDFSLAANPDLLTVQLGQNSQSQISVTSLSGFQGTVSFDFSESSPGLIVSMQNPSVNLSSGQTQNDNLRISTTNTSPTGLYVLTVKATSGLLVHSLNVTVRVPDLNLTANPDTLSVSPGSTGTSQISFQSLDGFQGGINTQVSVSPPGPKVSLNPNNPTLQANGTTTIVLNIQLASNQTPGVYNVTIRATAGALVHLLVVKVFVGQHTSSTRVSCSPSAVVVNEASTCTAIVNDTSTGSITSPTGTVSFTETGSAGSFNPTTCTLASGSCSVAFTPTATGNALVTATFGGDSSHTGSTSVFATVTVNRRTTSTAIVCSSPVVVNQASSCTATVSDTSPGTVITPTGGINFNETGTAGSFSSATCILVSGSCSVTFTATAAGTALISGTYRGDTVHYTSTSAAVSVTVNRRDTSTALVCTSPVVVNQASNCTATITDSSSGGSITPTGTVTFVSSSPGSFSATSCSIATVSSGVAGCSVSYTPSATGNHLITGSYTGDAVHFGNNGASTVTVGQRATNTAMSCVQTGLPTDQTCTATVTDNSPGTVVTPTGAVSFTTNSTGTFSSNTCTLSSTGTSGVGTCQVTYTPIAVATHTIKGAYSGDTIHLSSQGSASISFGKDSTTTAIACSPSSVAINQATACIVTVNDTATIGPTPPTGTVDFASNVSGSFAGSPCTLVSQTKTSSSCQVSYTPTSGAGTHDISATYNGDAIHNGSTSSQAFALTVPLRTASTTVSCSPSSVVVNQATNCTAVVADSAGSGAIIPTGSVSFAPGGSCTLVSGSCSVSVTPSASGSLPVSASYGGDSSHGTSSGGTTVPVGNRATSTSVSCSPSPVTNNTVTSCLAKVVDTGVGTTTTPSGSVGFASNSTGIFSQPSCTLVASGTVGVASCSVNYTPGATGFQAITTSYAGDSTHLSSNGSAVVTVFAPSPAPAYALVVSTDGRVSRLYQNGTLTLIGQPVTTPLRAVAWKPDGSYALIPGDFAVLLKYDGTTLTTIPTGISTGYNFWAISWKPDGSYALVGGSAGLLFKFDGVQVTKITNPFATTPFAISWNPSGSTALIVGRNGLVLTYDGTNVRSFTSGTTFDLDAAAWNPNGAYALIGGLNRTLLQFNGTGIAAINISLISSNTALRAIAFNPTGSLALLVGDSGTVLTYNGSTLTLLAKVTSSPLYAVSWSSSGTAYIVGNSGTVLSYSSGTLTKLSTTPISTSNFRGIAWKP